MSSDIEFVDERELPEVRYRNEYVKKWSEVGAALRYRLRIEERDAYDAKASAASPEPLEPGDEVEVKACKKWVENGDEYGTIGRWHLTESSHDTLLSHGGYYVLVVYDFIEIEGAGGKRVCIEGIDLISADEVDDRLFRRGGYDEYRLGYDEFFPGVHPRNESSSATPSDDGQRAQRKSGASGEGDTTDSDGTDESGRESVSMETAVSSEERYPKDLREFDIWCVWAFDAADRKRPRAPWQTGHCYPVSWGESVAERPETGFEEALKFSRFGPEIAEQWPFPDDAPDRNLKLGMFLPHEPPEPPIMQIDLDNVRSPETGEVVPEAADILDTFPETYAMVSVSGKGLHLYVRAGLPDRGKFVEPLGEYDGPVFERCTEPPQLEMYDHGRFCAITGEHIDGSGTEISEAQERVTQLVEQWETVECDSCGRIHRARELPAEAEECPDCGGELNESGGFDPEQYRRGRDSRSSSGNKSPYYTEPIAGFGRPRANGASTSEGFGGAHPAHGGTSSPDSESTNYAVNVDKNTWHCFAHGSGGGPLSLVAVIEGELGCRNPELAALSDESFTRLCLIARDGYGFTGDPPYRAVRGVARHHGLAMADAEEGILGKDCYSVARKIYDGMDASEL